LEEHRENAAGKPGGESVVREDGVGYDAGPLAARKERDAFILRRLDVIEAEVAEIRKAMKQGG
jgi:hypothetical protein